MNKKVIRILVLMLSIILMVSGCSEKYDAKDGNRYPIKRFKGSFTVDPNNAKAIAGFADYVFVGYVNRLTKTIYRNPVNIETKDGGTSTIADPYTVYEVTVVKNIKGNLIQNQEIPILKEGGITQDKKEVQLYEDDTLPLEGKYYIFVGYAQSDGSILISGPKSNVELKDFAVDPSAKKSLVRNKLSDDGQILKMQKAVEDQIPRDRKRFKSKYESK